MNVVVTGKKEVTYVGDDESTGGLTATSSGRIAPPPPSSCVYGSPSTSSAHRLPHIRTLPLLLLHPVLLRHPHLTLLMCLHFLSPPPLLLDIEPLSLVLVCPFHRLVTSPPVLGHLFANVGELHGGLLCGVFPPVLAAEYCVAGGFLLLYLHWLPGILNPLCLQLLVPGQAGHLLLPGPHLGVSNIPASMLCTSFIHLCGTI